MNLAVKIRSTTFVRLHQQNATKKINDINGPRYGLMWPQRKIHGQPLILDIISRFSTQLSTD